MATCTLELLYERHQIPLEPFVRTALVADVWSSSGDSLDTHLSHQVDLDTGIDRTSFFVDATRPSVDDFGSRKGWQLAPSYWAWSAGIRFALPAPQTIVEPGIRLSPRLEMREPTIPWAWAATPTREDTACAGSPSYSRY